MLSCPGEVKNRLKIKIGICPGEVVGSLSVRRQMSVPDEAYGVMG